MILYYVDISSARFYSVLICSSKAKIAKVFGILKSARFKKCLFPLLFLHGHNMFVVYVSACERYIQYCYRVIENLFTHKRFGLWLFSIHATFMRESR